MNNLESNCSSMLIAVIVLAINAIVGGWSVNYILNFFGKDIPFYADCAIGFFAVDLTIPIAIILWIISLF